MRCYLRPQNIKAISFDLDDTLYDNYPHILRAEETLIQFLHEHYPLTQTWHFHEWRVLKLQLLKQKPELAHDASAARIATLEQGLARLGYSDAQAKAGAQAGLDCFYFHRSDFRVSAAVLTLLGELAKHYRLVGITNGNVDAKRIGLGNVLEFVLHPGNGVRMKPAKDMFIQAVDKLQIQPEQLLHVGDSIHADVCGARLAGCQAAWLNPSFGRVDATATAQLLPHIEMTNIHSLADILLP